MEQARNNARWRTYLATLAGGQRLLLATAVIVGLGAGLGAIVFRWLIERVHHLSFEVLPELVGRHPIYLILVPGAACIGRTVARMSRKLPAESLLVSIRRIGGEVVFPHGDTVFESGDTIVASVRTGREDDLRRALTG